MNLENLETVNTAISEIRRLDESEWLLADVYRRKFYFATGREKSRENQIGRLIDKAIRLHDDGSKRYLPVPAVLLVRNGYIVESLETIL